MVIFHSYVKLPEGISSSSHPYNTYLVGGIPTPLKNDGVRHLGRKIIPHIMEKINIMFEKYKSHLG